MEDTRPPILKDFPDEFETERLLIRSPMPGDGAEFHSAKTESIDELKPWMDWARQEITVDGEEENMRRARARFLERTDLMMLLFLKGTGTLVGTSGLHRMDWSVPRFEIGYWCRTRYAGRGYVTEAVRGIAGFAFEHLGARRVEIRSDALNRRSARVAERRLLPGRGASKRRARRRRGAEERARLLHDPRRARRSGAVTPGLAAGRDRAQEASRRSPAYAP